MLKAIVTHIRNALLMVTFQATPTRQDHPPRHPDRPPQHPGRREK